MECKIEGCNEEHYGKGYCRYHYKWFVEAGHTGAPNTICQMCGKQIKRRRGSKFCSATCQMKWHRRYGCYSDGKTQAQTIKQGTEREAFKHKAPTACRMDDCNHPAIALGLCEAHYRTNLRHGQPVSLLGYGQRRKHPLYTIWNRQARTEEGRVEAWEDFWQFVADVGSRPSLRHTARRHDPQAPWAPGNFYWHHLGEKDLSLKEQASRWRKKNPMRAKGHHLRQHYGIGIEEYSQMYEAQKGKCAICGGIGDSYNNSIKGGGKTLVVDHCHTSKQVRELLCTDCNRALGMFKDSPKILANAIEYLKKHESQP